MPRRDADKSVSICDGFRIREFPLLLAVMLFATPPLAFAQDSLDVTVDPRVLTIPEGQTDADDATQTGATAEKPYDISLDTKPTGAVTVRVEGASGDINVNPSTLCFFPNSDFLPSSLMTTAALSDINSNLTTTVWSAYQTVMVRAADGRGCGG